ncbi:MAG: diguanylate cyclase [Gammaproteobacteria bacterium]|nr:diguanylate cyclase [Gammaproteobacteria bacterium]
MTEPLNSTLAATILQSAPFGVALLDAQNRLVMVNRALETFLGMPAAKLTTEDADLAQDIRKCLYDPQELIHLPQSGARPARWLKCWRQTLEGGQGNVRFYADVTTQQQLQQENERLREQHDLQDPLTSLPNRRAIVQALEPQVSRSRRYENPLSVIVLKIANYSRLGADGDSSADRAVVAIGQFLKDQVRWVDMTGRMDNDEFLLILPETPEAAARELATKLHNRISDLAIATADGRSVNVDVRCGVAGWIKGDDTNKLLQRAHQTLSGG